MKVKKKNQGFKLTYISHKLVMFYTEIRQLPQGRSNCCHKRAGPYLQQTPYRREVTIVPITLNTVSTTISLNVVLILRHSVSRVRCVESFATFLKCSRTPIRRPSSGNGSWPPTKGSPAWNQQEAKKAEMTIYLNTTEMLQATWNHLKITINVCLNVPILFQRLICLNFSWPHKQGFIN